MRAEQLRNAWAQFWTERQHTSVESAGLIPLHPSAPMFTNSGMMPFVPYFIGEEAVPYQPPRASSIQACVRAGGKHNDLDAIGRSPRHLSFFEMLGNFGFGDYFKSDAIKWAWEFTTETLGLDGERIWVTCHVDDDEAVELWVDEIGFPIERIARLDEDNFWEMGDTGPCGPCSELFWDFGSEFGPDGGPANPAAENRFVEFWNLVFQQYSRQEDGSLRPLKSKNIDTGAGLERLLGVTIGSPNVFDTDELAGLVDAAQSFTGVGLGADPDSDVALKLLADHARTMSFLVADGVMPSNEDRGYVLRRIIRRAVRFSYLLGVDKPISSLMAERVIEIMGSAYPHLVANSDTVLSVLGREEEQFRRTLKSGLTILDSALEGVEQGGALGGAVAFQLHDTYGFPLEVTTEIAQGRGFEVDRAGFDAAMADQRDRARKSAKKGTVAVGDEADAFQSILESHGPTEFVGRDLIEDVEATVVGVVPGTDGVASVFLDRTPFYAESGGQVGDTGRFQIGELLYEVTDTVQALPGLHRHIVVGGADINVGSTLTASIDVCRRNAIRRNHTGTHLLHWALREVLGSHVKQQGSWVGPDRLRFDFSHFEAVTPAQISMIEDLVNSDILNNTPVRHFETTKDEALELGAIAFFGEKYGDVVRVLEAGPHSTELCGGTHVSRTGDIGPIKVIGESSIGSNLRRIEAVSGMGPIDRLRREEAELGAVSDRLGVPRAEVLDGIDKRLSELKELKAELKSLKSKLASSGASDLAASAVDGVVIARVDGLGRDDLRSLGVAVRDQAGIKAVVLIGAPEGGGVALVAAVAPESGFNAGELLSGAARAVKGGGGKDPVIAVAGGKNPEGIDEALEAARASAGLI